jgi:hypothetical protein
MKETIDMLTHEFKQSSLFDQYSPPVISKSSGTNPKLEVIVVFTSVEGTVAAMHRTAALLKGLNGHISLLDFQTIPHQLPLENPPVSSDFTEHRLLAITNASSVDTTAHVFLCRYPLEALTSVLKAGSLIVMGCRKRWWPTWETKLARKLRQAGYQIILHKI